jgi:hypothetical protein
LKFTRTIQSIIGFILLCVFAIGITPKQVLHDALTTHQHVLGKEKGTLSVSKDRYNCDEENLVAESPFVVQDYNHTICVRQAFLVKPSIFLSSYSFIHRFFFELRGPPALA